MKILIAMIGSLFCFSLPARSETDATEILAKITVSEGMDQIHSQCKKIDAIGSSGQIYESIRQLVNHQLSLIKKHHPAENLKEITATTQKVKIAVEKAIELTASEWTSPIWSPLLEWHMGLDKFDLVPNDYERDLFRINDTRVNYVYYLGDERRDIEHAITIKKSASGLRVGYRMKTNSISLCQLISTFTAVVDVDYEYGSQSDTQRFILHVNPVDR